MSDFIIDCKQCTYFHNCPCGWNNCNAACLVIQKPIEITSYEEIEPVFSYEEIEQILSRIDCTKDYDRKYLRGVM